MTLIKSISGIRGTIGGRASEGLTPLDVVKFTSAYATWCRSHKTTSSNTIVVGRDARISGQMVNDLVSSSLVGMGFDVLNIGLASTPTTEMAVILSHAAGGLILTASHNPSQWNALKLLNENGEFLSAEDGAEVLSIAQEEDFVYASIDSLGTITHDTSFTSKHIDQILALPLVDVAAIRNAHFHVTVDVINSVGALCIPPLLNALGVSDITILNGTPNGHFAHNPEPLPENLSEISRLTMTKHAHVGFVVDPDVDRLAIVCEDGSMFGEEYTLVAVSDFILKSTPGNTVSNLSSTRALRDLTEKFGQSYTPSAVGEVNVTTMMKQTQAVIGGEGNGGVIYPTLHYGRDALVGIALFLTHLAHTGLTPSALRKTYPDYFISKNKISLAPTMDVDGVLSNIANQYAQYPINTSDGVKIDFPSGWVHLRKSNTEPIIRIYAEAHTQSEAESFVSTLMSDISHFTLI